MKSEPKSTATVYGEMDAWCRGIDVIYNCVHNINQVLPRNVVHIDNGYGAVTIYAGSDPIYELPVWDLVELDRCRDFLDFLSDFCWGMHKAFISESLNDSLNSSYTS